jgi:O-antigen ligase
MFRILAIFLVFFPIIIFPDYVSVVKMGLLTYLCLSIWIFIIWKRYRMKENVIEKKLYMPELFLLLFAIWAGLSALLSNHPYISLFGTYTRHEGLLALYSYFTIFFIAFRFSSIEKYTFWLIGLVSMSFISGMYGLLQKFPLSWLPLEGSGRVESFFGNPNFYGSYLVIMLFLAILLTLTFDDRLKKMLYFLVAQLLFINVLYCGTRSAFVGIAVGLIFFTLYLWPRVPHLRKRYTGLLLSFMLVFFVVNALDHNGVISRAFSIFESAGQVLQNNEESGHAGSYRWKLWQIALPLVGEYPIWGSGPDTIKFVFDQDAIRTYTNIEGLYVDKVHNEYLQIAITMGIPALLFYLAFLSTVLWAVWKSLLKRNGENQLLLAGLFAIILGFMAQAFFNISVVPVAPFFWLILGLAYRLAKVE